MIITKTPFRISFFGGGTDYPEWYLKNSGQVLGTTINKYAYISCRRLASFNQHKYQIVYSEVERCNEINDIKHPAAKACIELSGLKEGLEIHYDSDMPARSGLGSSSTYTVGLLQCLYAYRGIYRTKRQLANEAISIEHDVLKEHVGVQDQIHASFGGFNHVKLDGDAEFSVNPVIINSNKKQQLNENLMLFYTGISRFSSNIAKSQIDSIENNSKQLNLMSSYVDEALDILGNDKRNINDFGLLINESWLQKRQLSNDVSNSLIDDFYNIGINAGALGGKILGAGGGGFLLFYVEKKNQVKVKTALSKLVYVPFEFSDQGSEVIFHHDQK